MANSLDNIHPTTLKCRGFNVATNGKAGLELLPDLSDIMYQLHKPTYTAGNKNPTLC